MKVAALALAAVLLAGCSVPDAPPATPAGVRTGTGASSPGLPPSSGSSTPSPTTSPTSSSTSPACTAEASALGLRRQVGQLIMVGVGVGSPQRAVIRRYSLGSAIVMGPTPGGVRQVAALTKTLRSAAGDTGMLVAADQEGGTVQRLRGPGFARIPSGSRQAALSDARLKARATTWGRAMAKAGVLLDLAPVADVVPAANRARNQPIARLGRGYGSDPATVSAKVEAFRAGLADAGVAVAVKHFPGLGAVTGNTDFAAKVVDRTTTARSPLLQPFRDAAASGAEAVMVSSAFYARIDPDRPALFSPDVIGLLRGWGFDGVVVSDDLGAAAALKSVPVSRRASRFVAAGGDLALTVDARAAGHMAEGLYRKARTDSELAARVAESAARVLALKAALGLYRCG
jgi:beta-N-acetylhexosaminidase